MAFPIGQNFGFDLRLNFGAGSMPGIGNTSLLPGFGSDGFSGSPFLNDFSSALGGLGTGFGNPMVGMPNLGGANPQQLLGLVSLLANLLGGQMNQGMGAEEKVIFDATIGMLGVTRYALDLQDAGVVVTQEVTLP